MLVYYRPFLKQENPSIALVLLWSFVFIHCEKCFKSFYRKT